jgi:hypothetical protein
MVPKNKSLIIIALLIGVVAFAGMIAFIGQGNVRHVSIFWQERVQQTVAFEDIDGQVQLLVIQIPILLLELVLHIS